MLVSLTAPPGQLLTAEKDTLTICESCLVDPFRNELFTQNDDMDARTSEGCEAEVPILAHGVDQSCAERD